MSSVAEVKGFTWPIMCFDWGRDGVNHHSKEVQEMVSQKAVEGQTHSWFSDGLVMFEGGDVVSDLIFEK